MSTFKELINNPPKQKRKIQKSYSVSEYLTSSRSNESLLDLYNSGNNRILDSENDEIGLDEAMREFTKAAEPPKETKARAKITRNMAFDLSEKLAARMSLIIAHKALNVFVSPIYRNMSDDELILEFKRVLTLEEISHIGISVWVETIRHLRTNPNLVIPDDLLKCNHQNYFVFRNGIFDMGTGRLRPATDQDMCFSYCDVEFDPQQHKCSGEVFENYLDDICCGDESIRNLIWSVIGCLLSQSVSFKKIFILYGPSNSGKTIFGSLMEDLVGESNCSHVTIQGFEEKNSTSLLLNKQLNSSLDLSAKPIKDTALGILKQLSGGGGDWIKAEFKYGAITYLKPDTVKLLFATNHMIRVNTEDADAFFSRLVIIPFLNSIPPERQDRDLKNKLFKEKDYIIQKAIKAFKNLYDNHFVFPYCQTAESIRMHHFAPSSKSVTSFVEDRCILQKDLRTYTDSLFDAYENYSFQQNCATIGYNDFRDMLEKHYNLIPSKWFNQDRAQNKRGFIGIGLRIEL